jgi:hypothetical protein
MEAKSKHLEFIQAAINRMAGNSFLLKGWSVTVSGGLLAFSFKELDWRYVYISIALLVVFWLLDSYYLSRERRFIRLYDHARGLPESSVDFSMNPHQFGRRSDWMASAWSPTLLIFYGGLLAVQLLLTFFL